MSASKKVGGKYIGAHVSASGGVDQAPLNAQAIAAHAFALFLKNQRQWVAPAYASETIRKFRQNCQQHAFAAEMILPHAGYLINLASPEEAAFFKARNAFCDEAARANQLGLKLINIHPGAHLGKQEEAAAIAQVAGAINWLHQQPETGDVRVILENTAGQGSCLGHRLEQLKAMIEQVEDQSRIGVCIDTCHLFAAGYELRTTSAWQEFWHQFEELIGFEFLAGMHLNDSKVELGSRVDRHQSLGKGHLGLAPFEWLMSDARFDGIPLVLETIDETIWREEIELLYSFTKK